MRRERFDIVHVHTPVAAALGRIAAKLAQVPIVIYTAYSFYFHNLMPPWRRRPIIWIERWLGRCCTEMLFSQSAEDAKAAIQERIMPEDKVVYIGNGVSLEAFGLPPNPNLRAELGLGKKDKVVGFIGRLVQEKGVLELLEAMQEVVRRGPSSKTVGCWRHPGKRPRPPGNRAHQGAH